MREYRVILLPAMMAGTILTGGAVQAQDGEQDIIVTAQRRSERLEDVPISMTAASAATLERSGIQRLEDINQIAPGIQISRTGIYSQPSVRGVTTALAATPENNVATYVDGVYIRSARGINSDLVNIASVQVLKGPQGTLFGRNATGGAILIETLQPSLSETTGRVSATYARFNDRRAQGYVSTPLGTKAALGVMGSFRESDGYLRDIGGFDTAPLGVYSFGGRLRLEPTEDFSLTAKLDWSRVSDGRSNAPTFNGRSAAALTFPGSYLETRPYRTSLSHPITNRSTMLLGSLKAEYRFEGATLTSISSYQDENNFLYFDPDGSARVLYDEYNTEDYRTVQQEFNLTSTGDGPLQYVLGLYYFHNTIDQYKRYLQSFPSTQFVQQQRTRRTSDAYAAYADVTWRATDKLFLTAGLRYSHEKPRLNLTAPTGATIFDGAQTFNSATPRVVIRYEMAPATNVYASYSKGFKSGSTDSTAVLTQRYSLAIRPEKIDAWEIGFKTKQGRIRFETAGYYYDYKDLQVGSVVIIDGNLNTVTANAATAEIYGAEAQLSGELFDRLNLNAGVAYTHARYKNFPNATVSLPSATTGLNSANCPNAANPCTENWSGQRIVRSPDWTVNLGVDYTIPTGFGDLLLGANGTYTSEFSPQKSDRGLNGTGYRYLQPETFIVNLRAALTLPGDHVTVSVFGRNVTDEITYLTRSGNAFGDYETLGEPATYGVTLDYRF